MSAKNALYSVYGFPLSSGGLCLAVGVFRFGSTLGQPAEFTKTTTFFLGLNLVPSESLLLFLQNRLLAVFSTTACWGSRYRCSGGSNAWCVLPASLSRKDVFDDRGFTLRDHSAVLNIPDFRTCVET
jgi:hypothetical protein